MPIITLLTDFGLADPFVGIMKGVILSRAPNAVLVDLTHSVPPQDIMIGALQLRSAVPYFPAGTIHTAIVDPGVGSARRGLVIETNGGFLVGPDNGLLSLAAALAGRRRAHVIENTALLPQQRSQTFHGRDVFAPIAAQLARGVAIDAVGPAVESIVELHVPEAKAIPGGLRGQVICIDGFGNLITNIPAAALHDFPAQSLCVSIAEVQISSVQPTYSSVPIGELVAVLGSWELLEISIRNGNAARALSAGVGSAVTVVWALQV